MPNSHKFKYNDKWYQATLRFETVLDSDGISFHPQFPSGESVMKMANVCENCHRGDWVPVVHRSFEVALEAGLFVEATDGLG